MEKLQEKQIEETKKELEKMISKMKKKGVVTMTAGVDGKKVVELLEKMISMVGDESYKVEGIIEGGIEKLKKMIINATGDWSSDQKYRTEANIKAIEKTLNGKAPTVDNLRSSGFKEMPDDESKLHQNGVGKPERKFTHPNGAEVVLDGDTLEVVTDPRIIGTYNYESNPNATHFIKDIIPWLWNGTGPDDPSTRLERFDLFRKSVVDWLK